MFKTNKVEELDHKYYTLLKLLNDEYDFAKKLKQLADDECHLDENCSYTSKRKWWAAGRVAALESVLHHISEI